MGWRGELRSHPAYALVWCRGFSTAGALSVLGNQGFQGAAELALSAHGALSPAGSALKGRSLFHLLSSNAICAQKPEGSTDNQTPPHLRKACRMRVRPSVHDLVPLIHGRGQIRPVWDVGGSNQRRREGAGDEAANHGGTARGKGFASLARRKFAHNKLSAK